jgi:hypothetical protein
MGKCGASSVRRTWLTLLGALAIAIQRLVLPSIALTTKTLRTITPGRTRWEERRGWGWTIMVMAEKRA